MSKETVKKGTASELKRIFGKSMANRLVSRVVLNKFIQELHKNEQLSNALKRVAKCDIFL